MSVLTEKIKKKIKDHALSDPKNEVCGLIMANQSVILYKNIAADREPHFIISHLEINKAQKKDKLIAVYHSHIQNKEDKDDKLSNEDEVIAEYFNVRFVLYSVNDDKFFEYVPTGKRVDYLNRPYVFKILDEVTLIKDYYEWELNVKLENLKNRENLELFLKENGFVESGELQKGDVILIHLNNDPLKPKLLLYTENDKVIIHKEYELSKVTEYNYGLKKWTKKIYRHQKL